MALDLPPQNKMMTAPPVKKGFHFASDRLHFAEFIEAATIEEAQLIYKKIRRLIVPSAGGTAQPAPSAEQSTTAPAEPEEKALLQ